MQFKFIYKYNYKSTYGYDKYFIEYGIYPQTT